MEELMVWRKAIIEHKGTTNFGPGVQEFTESPKPLATRARQRARLVNEDRIKEVLALAERLKRFKSGDTDCDTRFAYWGTHSAMEYLVTKCGGVYALHTTSDFDKFVVMPAGWQPDEATEKRIVELERQAQATRQRLKAEEKRYQDSKSARHFAKNRVDPKHVDSYPGADKPGPVIRYGYST